MTDVNLPVPTESNKQYKYGKTNLFFVGILEVTDEKSRIRIRKSSVRIRIRTKMSGSLPYLTGTVRLFEGFLKFLFE